VQRDDRRERAAGLDARHGERLQAPRQPEAERVVSLRRRAQQCVHAQAAAVAGLRSGQQRRYVRCRTDNLLLLFCCSTEMLSASGIRGWSSSINAFVTNVYSTICPV